MTDTDVIVIGAGLAGLVAATELTRRGQRVIVLDAEPAASLGGQAFWSFGGLFLVNSPEQRRLGLRDSAELAFSDWLGSAEFAPGADRGQGPDAAGYAWAENFVEFAAGPMRQWLHEMGVRWFPLVQWAERGGYLAGGHGNTLPRFHVTWGTGPGVLAPFLRAARFARSEGLLEIRFRHRARELVVTDGAVTGVRADVLAPTTARRGEPTSREVTDQVELAAGAVVIATGGCRRSCSPACRTAPTAPGWLWPPAPGRRWCTPTGCGTTRRASRCPKASGPGTGCASCPGPARSGWTRRGSGCRHPCSPGSMHSAHWST